MGNLFMATDCPCMFRMLENAFPAFSGCSKMLSLHVQDAQNAFPACLDAQNPFSACTGCSKCIEAHHGGSHQCHPLHIHLQLCVSHHRAPGLKVCQVQVQAPARRHHEQADTPHLRGYVSYPLLADNTPVGLQKHEWCTFIFGALLAVGTTAC